MTCRARKVCRSCEKRIGRSAASRAPLTHVNSHQSSSAAIEQLQRDARAETIPCRGFSRIYEPSFHDLLYQSCSVSPRNRMIHWTAIQILHWKEKSGDMYWSTIKYMTTQCCGVDVAYLPAADAAQLAHAADESIRRCEDW